MKDKLPLLHTIFMSLMAPVLITVSRSVTDVFISLLYITYILHYMLCIMYIYIALPQEENVLCKYSLLILDI